MVLPNKHLPLNRSLLAVGADILRLLDVRPRTVSSVWDQLRTHDNKTSFEQFTLGVCFLFVLGAVDFSGDNLRKTTK